MSTASFRRFMDMPHRRPAYGVNSPAVFRHLVFRIDDHLKATDFEGARNARDAFLGELNDKLGAIQTTCGAMETYLFRSASPTTLAKKSDDAAKEPNPSWKSTHIVEPNRTLLTELREDDRSEGLGWRIRMLVDFHSEYYCITFILDQKNSAALDASGDAKRAVDYEKLLSERDKVERAAQAAADGSQSAAIIGFFYEDIWTKLNAFIKGQSAEAPQDDVKLPGTLFAEFRAIALRDLESEFAKRKKSSDKRKIFLTGDPDTDTDFSISRYRLREWVSLNEDFVQDILKFNQLTQRVDRDANCVLCEVLDGGAIYGSSLGQIPVFPTADGAVPKTLEQKTPLRYFIVHNDLSKYQLGRLIRRHHVLGELRMAALFDLDQIVQAGARIRALGNKINERVKNAAENSSGRASVTFDDLAAFQQELNGIQSAVSLGGLSYRVARSAYYAENFGKRVEEMRIHRLEGWEPYNTFIARNLYQVFNFIATVGVRYQTLSERVNRLATAHNVERMTHVTQEILKIQYLGEAIGIGAFAYYGGTIIAVVAKSIVKATCLAIGHDANECHEVVERIDEFVEVAGIVIALTIAVLCLERVWNWWTRTRGSRVTR